MQMQCVHVLKVVAPLTTIASSMLLFVCDPTQWHCTNAEFDETCLTMSVWNVLHRFVLFEHILSTCRLFSKMYYQVFNCRNFIVRSCAAGTCPTHEVLNLASFHLA